jgi:hypothetical protein
MDLLQILEKVEKLEREDLLSNNRFRLTDRIVTLPWKRNYWHHDNILLQDRPQHKNLIKRRKRNDHSKKLKKKEE